MYLPKSHIPCILILWVVAGGIYFKTLGPSILYIDSGTMVAAAHTLGIANPPGFPAYLFIAHLFTKLPFGSGIFKVQLLSVVSALGVLTIVYFLIHRLVSNGFYYVGQPKEDITIFGKDYEFFKKLKSLPPTLIKVCALAAAIALAFSYQFWSQTLNTESYIFTNFLMISMLAIVLTITPKDGNVGKKAFAIAVLLGIGSGVNPTIIQVVPALVVVTIFYFKKIGFRSLILSTILVILITGIVYSYLPIRASQYPFVNWGNPQTLELFLGHLRGAGLNINDPRTNSINGFTGSPQIFAQSAGRYLYLFFPQFTPILTPLIGLGAYYLFKKNKRLLLFLSTIPITNFIFGGLYLSGNQESWFVASYIIFTIFLGVGLIFLVQILTAFSLSRRILATRYFIVLSILISLIPFIWWFPKLDRSGHMVTQEYMENLYSNLPKNSVLIGSGDFFNSMSLYQHEVVNTRNDVFPVVANMWYILPWYRDNLRHQNPDIMPLELESMIKKDRYEEYREVMNWYIKYLIDKGYPVYVTPMVFRETVLAGTDMGKFVPDPKILKVVSGGLSYRMLGAQDLLAPSEENFNYKFKDPKFYKKPPYYIERNYKAGYYLLLREYGLGFVAMADYFTQAKNQEKAQEYFDKAYAIAPFDAEIVNKMAIFSMMKGDAGAGVKYFKQALEVAPSDASIMLNLANAYISAGKNEEAKQFFENISKSTSDPSMLEQARQGLAKITMQKLAQVPGDWKKFESKEQKYEFKYPSTWKLAQEGKITVIKAPTDEYVVKIFAGAKAAGTNIDEWVKSSPIKISGKVEERGLAQVPGFDATAAFWTGVDGKKQLEFVLLKEDRIVHILVGPAESNMMEEFDRVVSTLGFY